MNSRDSIDAVPSGADWAKRAIWITGALLVLVGIMIGGPIAERVLAASRDGYSACEGFTVPEGAVVDEVWEHQPRARVTAIPPELRCTYLSSSGTDIAVVHDLGRAGAGIAAVFLGAGVILVARYLRTRVRDEVGSGVPGSPA